MAVERTGTAVNISTSSNSSSQSITVPSDATLAVVFAAGLSDTTADFDSGGISITLGGSAVTYVARSPTTVSCDVSASYLINPATGSQTLAWTFPSTVTYGNLITVVFYKGTDTTSPIRSNANAEQVTGSPITISSLTVESNDMTVGGVSAHNSTVAVNGNSQTSIAINGPEPKQGSVYLGVAEKAASSSWAASWTGDAYAGAVAIVIKPTAETGTLTQHSFRFFNDDGSESAATAKAALNTNVNLSANDVARIRFLIDATNDPTARKFQLEYRKKPSGGSFGPWTEVN